MKRLLLWSIRSYKRYVSPLLPMACRFVPTCSQYVYQAIERYGILRGSIRGLRRILSCHPWSKGGYDPI